MSQTFDDFWKENEKRLWRRALYRWGAFYSMSSADWDDAFQKASIRIYDKWSKLPSSTILASAYRVVNNVFHEEYRKYCQIHRIVLNIKEPDDEDGNVNIYENFSDENALVNEDAYIDLQKSINNFVESCARQHAKNKKDKFTSSPELIEWMFYERISDKATGKDIQEQTKEMKINGWAENSQSQVLKFMRECISKRAILAGFKDDISVFRN